MAGGECSPPTTTTQPAWQRWVPIAVVLAVGDGCGRPRVTGGEALRDAAAARGVDAGEDAWALPPPVVLPPPVMTDGGAAEVAGAVPVDVVYAHSGRDLYRVDPQTLEISRVGAFTLVSGAAREVVDVMTDIAVDRSRRVVGLTAATLMEIDPATAACKAIASLPGGQVFNGLSWIRTESGPEVLVATTVGGGVFRIDPASGAATAIGMLGGGLQSSGDLVSVASYGTLLTVSGVGGDRLARLDPATGAATVIGEIGFPAVWGLGFWKNKVFGFTASGAFLLIDPRTGAGTLVRSFPSFSFFGAGVTTQAPVSID